MKAPVKPAEASEPAAPSRPAPPLAVRPRLSGDDLIAELFEACVELHLLRNSLDAAEFALALMLDKLPSAVGLVSLFDVSRREYVVVRQLGGKSALLSWFPEETPLALAATGSHRAVVIPDAAQDRRAADDRWRATGVELRSLLCAPVELAGRVLGLIEIANPLDGGSFTEGDGNALTYIGQQLGELVGVYGAVLDPDLVLAAAEGPDRGEPPRAPTRGAR